VDECRKFPSSSTKTALYVDECQKFPSSSTKTALYVDECRKFPSSSTKTAQNVEELLKTGRLGMYLSSLPERVPVFAGYFNGIIPYGNFIGRRVANVVQVYQVGTVHPYKAFVKDRLPLGYLHFGTVC